MKNNSEEATPKIFGGGPKCAKYRFSKIGAYNNLSKNKIKNNNKRNSTPGFGLVAQSCMKNQDNYVRSFIFAHASRALA